MKSQIEDATKLAEPIGARKIFIASLPILAAATFALATHLINARNSPPSQSHEMTERAGGANRTALAGQSPVLDRPATLSPSSSMELPESRALSAIDERRQAEDRLVRSGEQFQSWQESAQRALAAIPTITKNAGIPGGVKVSKGRCFRDGCEVEATYASTAIVRKTDELLLKSEIFKRYHGSKFRTGPVSRKDGSVSTAWIFYSPDATN